MFFNLPNRPLLGAGKCHYSPNLLRLLKAQESFRVVLATVPASKVLNDTRGLVKEPPWLPLLKPLSSGLSASLFVSRGDLCGGHALELPHIMVRISDLL